jgi:hypothetical protein
MTIGTRIARVLTSLSIVAALAYTSSTQAAELAGVRLDETVRVANQELRLNGAGIRYKAIFKVYVAALYLADKKSTMQDVLSAAGAKRVTIVTLRDISSEELGRGFMSGIQQNIDRNEKSKLIGQLMKFGEIFASVPEGKKGDVITVDWIPGTGMVIHLNGRKLADPIPDVAFYNALLKIWLGAKPVDAQLKPLMLGEKIEANAYVTN